MRAYPQTNIERIQRRGQRNRTQSMSAYCRAYIAPMGWKVHSSLRSDARPCGEQCGRLQCLYRPHSVGCLLIG
jgi:hypothetical protein